MAVSSRDQRKLRYLMFAFARIKIKQTGHGRNTHSFSPQRVHAIENRFAQTWVSTTRTIVSPTAGNRVSLKRQESFHYLYFTSWGGGLLGEPKICLPNLSPKNVCCQNVKCHWSPKCPVTQRQVSSSKSSSFFCMSFGSLSILDLLGYLVLSE